MKHPNHSLNSEHGTMEEDGTKGGCVVTDTSWIAEHEIVTERRPVKYEQYEPWTEFASTQGYALYAVSCSDF